MINIILRGQLGTKFKGNQSDGSWLLDVQTPREAIHAIEANVGGMFKFLIEKEGTGIEYRVLIDGQDIEHLDQLYVPMGEYDTVEIIPIMIGEGNMGLWQIIGGILLIIVGIVIIVATSGAATGPVIGAIKVLGGALISAGIGLTIGGLISLAFGPANLDTGSKNKNKSSYLFSGQINSTRQGEAIPICYGRVIVGSQLISAYVTSAEMTKPEGASASDIPVVGIGGNVHFSGTGPFGNKHEF